VHSTAFRRLNHKTQVFIYHEGDHYRSRLTHSIEVAQIARAIARTLALDESLAEAIALAHDLGHPPFGHAGERALDAAMADYGGFDHNGQSLRVVTMLERKYAAFDGLNLTWEALEGLAKHNGPVLGPGGEPTGPHAHKGIPRALKAYNDIQDLELATYPGAEAQVAAIADDIAYNNHDIDDGFRAGSYPLDALAEVELTGGIIEEIRGLHPDLEASRVIPPAWPELVMNCVTFFFRGSTGKAGFCASWKGPGRS
jgi:dGTPase